MRIIRLDLCSGTSGTVPPRCSSDMQLRVPWWFVFCYCPVCSLAESRLEEHCEVRLSRSLARVAMNQTVDPTGDFELSQAVGSMDDDVFSTSGASAVSAGSAVIQLGDSSDPAGGMRQCFYCGQFVSVFIKKGNKDRPQFRCRPCNNSAVRMDGAAVTIEQKEQLRGLKKQPQLYKLQVVRFANSQLLGAIQRKTIITYYERLVATSRNIVRTGFCMMDEETYIAYQIRSRNQTVEVAKARWAAEKLNPDAKWEDEDDVAHLAVKMSKEYIHEASLAIERILEKAFGWLSPVFFTWLLYCIYIYICISFL
jgi:hypothetical protein